MDCDSPCYIMLGNWLDCTVDDFITEHSIYIIIKLSGDNGGEGPKPPETHYGTNAETGRKPTIIQCSINHRDSVLDGWHKICLQCLRCWQSAKTGKHPPTVFVHCNNGFDRGPAFMCLVAAKFMGCQPMVCAKILAQHRNINEMYSNPSVRDGKDERLFSNMKAAQNEEPQIIPYRDGLRGKKSSAFQANILWEHVPLDKRVRIFQPEGSKPEARVSQGSRAEGLLQDSVMA